MSGVQYAFEWLVDGKPVLQPDIALRPEPMFIDMPKGAASGRARFYLHFDDATSVLGKTEVTIKAICYRRDQSETSHAWQIVKTVEWKKYVPVSLKQVDDEHFALVELRDARYNYERLDRAKEFNKADVVTFGAASGNGVWYDEKTIKTHAVPQVRWNVGEILDDIMAPLSRPSFSGSVEFEDAVSVFGSPVPAIDGLLARFSLSLTIDRDGTLDVSDIADTAIPSSIMAARVDRVLSRRYLKNDEHNQVTIHPNKHHGERFNPEYVESIAGSSGSERVVVYDNFHTPDDTPYDAARKALIQQAAQDWYQAEKKPYDESFWGILDDVDLGPGVQNITWLLGDPVSGLGTRTRVWLDSPPMPWIPRCPVRPPVTLYAHSVNAVAKDSQGDFKVYMLVGGAWVDTLLRQRAWNLGAEIPADVRCLLFPVDHVYTAVELC